MNCEKVLWTKISVLLRARTEIFHMKLSLSSIQSAITRHEITRFSACQIIDTYVLKVDEIMYYTELIYCRDVAGRGKGRHRRYMTPIKTALSLSWAGG